MGDFGPRGAKFWREVRERFDLGIDEIEILVELCRTLDLLEELAALPVSPENAREQRLQRAELRHLASSLGLPDETGSPNVESGRSRAARKAAESRWKDNDG